MERDREPGHKPTHVVTSSTTQEPRTRTEEGEPLQYLVVGKRTGLVSENETRPLSCTTQKFTQDGLETRMIRPVTVKFLEENTEGSLLDVRPGAGLLDLKPTAKAAKAKTSKWDPR